MLVSLRKQESVPHQRGPELDVPMTMQKNLVLIVIRETPTTYADADGWRQ
jgi:hypothetical protein